MVSAAFFVCDGFSEVGDKILPDDNAGPSNDAQRVEIDPIGGGVTRLSGSLQSIGANYSAGVTIVETRARLLRALLWLALIIFAHSRKG